MQPEDPDPVHDPTADAAIPEAWRELVAMRDPVLFERLFVAVERRTGRWPDGERVFEFLSRISHPSHLETVRTSETHPGIGGPSIYPPPGKGAKEG